MKNELGAFHNGRNLGSKFLTYFHIHREREKERESMIKEYPTKEFSMTKIRKNLQQNRVVLATTQNRGRTSISPS
jgi:hypothetical protein